MFKQTFRFNSLHYMVLPFFVVIECVVLPQFHFLQHFCNANIYHEKRRKEE